MKHSMVKGHVLDFEHHALSNINIGNIFQWHTFHGSSIGSDSGNAIVVNGAGDIFFVGNSSLSWDGPGSTPPLNAYAGNDDIVIVKLDNNGFYQWHTFYGSVEADLGNGVALDQGGNIYVSGRSRSTWDGPLGEPPLNAHQGCSNDDLVVIKLNSDGEYQWHTFYGSVDQDTGNAIVLDTSDNIYVTGLSSSTWSGPGGQEPLNAHNGGKWDLTVVKLSSEGAYQWHSFYGSSEREAGFAIALDSAGHIYLTGRSDASWNGPGGENPINDHLGGNSDLVLIKIDVDGNFRWHTFYGSVDQDLAYSIAVDSANNIYLAGFSNSAWNGPDGESPLNGHSDGDRDAVILKVDSSGQYHWHTFHGSEKRDLGNAIAVDKADNIYITGYSENYWSGPALEEPLDEFFDNDANIFVLKLDSMGIYHWHSFYGAEGWNIGSAITADQADNLYLAGSSALNWDGPDDKEPRNEHSGPPNRDITVIKTYLDPPPQAGFLGSPTSGPVPLDVQFADQSTRTPLGWAWYFGDEDLLNNNWIEKTGSAAWAGRYGHVAVALPDESIVLLGGKVNGDKLNDVWRSADQGQTWTLINDNADWPKRFRHAGTVLPDGSIILMGGNGETEKLNDVWRSTDQGLTWKRLTFDAGWSKRDYLSAVALSDGSIVVTGGDDGTYQNDVWRSSDRGASWTRLTDNAPWSGRHAHTGVVLPDNSIVLMGGEADSGLTNDVWLSTDHGTSWSEVTSNAGWPARKWHTSAVLPDGSIINMGGYDGSSASNDLWRSVDGGSTWEEIHSNAAWEARALHVSSVLNDGSVVLLGGHDGSSPRNDVWTLKTASSNEQNPVHTYQQPGSYQVTLQSYNAAGYSRVSKPGYIEVHLPASDAKLSDLVVSEGTIVPDFHADITEYMIEVTHDIDVIDVIPTLSDENATMIFNGGQVVSGEAVTVALGDPGSVRSIKIEVTAEDGVTEKTYTLTVNRSEIPTEPTWRNIAAADAQVLTFSDGVLATSVEGYGIAFYDGEWTSLTTATALALATDGSVLVASVEGFGTWFYEGNWSKLTPFTAELLAVDNGMVAASFTEYGIWLFDGITWANLTPAPARALAFDSGRLVASVDGFGTWLYDEQWLQLTPETAQHLAISGSNIAASFAGFGIWYYDGNDWVNLTPVPARALALDKGILSASVDDFGTWLYDGEWNNILNLTADLLALDGGKVAASFKGQGIWLYE